MINFNILEEFNDIFKKPFTFYEISLNIFFIIIVGIISYIIYWSIINSNSIKYSKCKSKLKSLGSIADNYVVYTTDSNKNKLYNISYDAVDKKPTITCACPSGKYENTFDKIKVYNNIGENKGSYLAKKICLCDNDYAKDFNPSQAYYTGEPFLIKYMSDDNNRYGNIPKIEEISTKQSPSDLSSIQFPS